MNATVPLLAALALLLTAPAAAADHSGPDCTRSSQWVMPRQGVPPVSTPPVDAGPLHVGPVTFDGVWVEGSGSHSVGVGCAGYDFTFRDSLGLCHPCTDHQSFS